MPIDAHKNFAYSTLATSATSSGTTFSVAAGQGALFPTAPFNATVWPVSVQPVSTNAEIIRVTTVATDAMTASRAQESSTARTFAVGDQIAATVTAKTLTDVEGTFVQTTPADATSSTSAGKMMGFGTSATITPTGSGRVMFFARGDLKSSVAATINAQIRSASGTAPANGDAISGTTVGSQAAAIQSAAGQQFPVSLNGILTGLVVGTAYWIDIALGGTTGAITIKNVSISAHEI